MHIMSNERIVFFSGFCTSQCWYTMEEVMGIGDSEDNKVIDIKLELCCEIGNTPKISIKSESSDSMRNNTEDLCPKGSNHDNPNTRAVNINSQGINLKIKLMMSK